MNFYQKKILYLNGMKSLNNYITECGECPSCNCATPMNTLGMGNVDPCGTDPIHVKPHKRKTLSKYIKDKIRRKVREHVKEKDINEEY